MGTILVPLYQVLSGLTDSLRSVDIRVAAVRGRGIQPPSEDWVPLRSVVRISFRDNVALHAEYATLRDRLGPAATPDFAMFHEVIPFSELPTVPAMHGLTTRIDRDRPSVAPTKIGPPEILRY